MRERTALRFVWSPVEAPPLRDAVADLHGKRILVAGGSQDWSAALVTLLRKHGARCEASGAALQAPADPEAVARLAVESLAPLDGIIDLNLCGESGEKSENWETAVRHTVAVVRACYGDWLRETDAKRIFYAAITNMGGLMGYDSASVRNPLGGIWAGFAKTLPQELPNCNVKVVDVDSDDGDSAANVICKEVYQWGLFEIGYRAGRRHALQAQWKELPKRQVYFESGDVVLLSGGGRGIGFQLARYLAEHNHCKVIITGREAASATAAAEISLSDEEWRAHERRLLQLASADRTVAAAQREIQRGRQLRELRANLALVESRCLNITYEQCDVTDRDQVLRLVRRPGLRYKSIVHNAGISAPVRLAAKTAESFLSTLRTKIDGFFNLCQAAQGLVDGIFCNAGSLTGRWGGMIGETDYAAANEALTRCGMWASGRFGFPVKTICWPTWNRVGMIKNFDVASSYVSALDVREGVEHWRDELATSESCEVTYAGNIGAAVTPLQLRGFAPIPELPNVRDLFARMHALGEVVTFAPHSTLVNECRWSASEIPALAAFRFNGEHAVPISLLLNAASVSADWLQPIARDRLPLREICDLHVFLPCLRRDSGEFQFRCRLTSSWYGKDWLITAVIERSDTHRTILRCAFRYSATPPAKIVSNDLAAKSLEYRAISSPLAMDGRVLRGARWAAGENRLLSGALPEWPDSDLWSFPISPLSRLPIAALESIWRASTDSRETTFKELTAQSVVLFDGHRPTCVTRREAALPWQAHDHEGNLCFTLTGIQTVPQPEACGVMEVETISAGGGNASRPRRSHDAHDN